MDFFAASRAVILAFGQRILAGWANIDTLLFLRRGTRQPQGVLPLENRQQLERRRVAAQRKAPLAEPLLRIGQFETDCPRVILQRQALAWRIRKHTPALIFGRTRQQTAVGDRDETWTKTQTCVKIGLKPAQEGFTSVEL